MDKSRVCQAKTINLAESKLEKKTNILIYEKPNKCPPPPATVAYEVPPIPALPAKSIRVCTGAELKKMCKPPVCDCKPVQPNKTLLQSIGRLFGFGAKSVIAIGLVYWTYSQGMWGTSEESEQFYTNACATLFPFFCKEKPKKKKKMSDYCEGLVKPEPTHTLKPPVPPACKKLPVETEKSLYSMSQCWNHGISTVFESVAGLPTILINYIDEKLHPAKEICIPPEGSE